MTRAPSSRHVATRNSRARVQSRQRRFVPQAQRGRKSPVLPILLLAAGAALLTGGLASSSFLADGSARSAGGMSNMAIALIVLGAVTGGFGLAQMLRRAA
jgi:predicted phage tail protein